MSATPDAATDRSGIGAPSSTRDGWRLILSTLRTQRRSVAFGVVVGLIWTIGRVSVPLLVSMAIDDAIAPGRTGELKWWSLLIATIALVVAVNTGLRRYWAFKVSRTSERMLRDRIFGHLQRLHFAFHDAVQTGDLMSRANTDLEQIQQFVVMIPLTICNFVTVLAVTVILAVIDPWLTLLALGSLPFVNVLGRRFSTNLHPQAMAIQRESAQLASVVEETVSGVRIVKGFGSQAVQAARLGEEADDLYGASVGASRVRARYLPALDLVPNIGLILVLAYGGHQVIDGQLQLGTLVAFNLYIGLLIWPLRMTGQIIALGQRAAASAQRVDAVLATDPVIVDRPGRRHLPASGGEVRFESVSFSYVAGRDLPVLDHLDLTIQPGESVALVGATGSGKSTVARLLPRFYDVDQGQIMLDGVDIRDLGIDELRRSIGIVFEETFLFNDTVANNIAFADPDADDEDIHRAARLAGAHEFVADLPDGYRTEIGERGFSLSGGQRQRLAIARAILADPRVLILDDATSSVDPTKEHEIRDALGEVMRNRTTIVIAHRPATIALADRVVLLDRGRIVAEGTHEGLLATSDAYRRVLASAAEHEPELAGDVP
jgi:ATP-binding cassette subfamily B protein